MNVTAKLLLSVVVAGLTTMLTAVAQEIVTDPAKAGPDFAVQGEYEGEAQVLDGKAGAQVIALGDGKFRLVLYKGGLPGDGWKRGDKSEKVEGATKDGVTTFKSDIWLAAIKDGTLTINNSGGDAVGTLKRVERKSPTLGAKPPEGAVVLFDGKSNEHFPGGKVTEDGHLMAGVSTNKTADNYHLHLEFRTPFKPKARGQARGNSGVYIHGIYECQVLDSFGLDGKDNECGGIYKNSEPKVNMCFPPLTWQTYDIDFTAPTEKDGKKAPVVVTIKHNGVVIHDKLQLPKGTPGGKKEGYTYLQGHGNPVVYRNIWMVKN